MNKQKITILIAGILILLSVFIVLYQKEIIFNSDDKIPDSKALAIKDTSSVTKIFIADMHGNNVLLTKQNGLWMLRDSIPAMQYNVKSVLGTLHNIMIRQAVPENALENITKALAVGSTKVEVYQIAPKFSIFGIPFFTKERKTKTYFLGPATQDNLANYIYVEGMEEPYIAHIPGFRGFITPQFSQFESDWRSHVLFQTKLTRIQSVEFIDLKNPEESFSLVKSSPRSFDLFDSKQNQLTSYDTTKVLDMLSEFREKNYQTLLTEMTKTKKDSIIENNLFRIIKLTDTDGKITELFLYRLEENIEYLSEEGDLVDQVRLEISRDKCYGMLKDKPEEFYILQYFHFDRQLQPLSYFLHHNK